MSFYFLTEFFRYFFRVLHEAIFFEFNFLIILINCLNNFLQMYDRYRYQLHIFFFIRMNASTFLI
jgi:hypothetical protein